MPKRPYDYINELPENVFEITTYYNTFNPKFDRYWWDATNNRLIMKPKRMNKYKIVHPMIDKYHDSRFVHMYDINNNQIYVNYDYLEDSYSSCYYLSINHYDFDINYMKNNKY